MSKDVLSQIKEFNTGRVISALPLKYEVMAQDPFRFFRGTCHLYYHALAKHKPFPASPAIWICGDLHIENFGSYRGANRLIYFDMNDFDESIRAPALLELSRLLTSLEIATIELGYKQSDRTKLCSTLIESYRQTIIKRKSIDIEKETARGLIKGLVYAVADRKEKALIKERTAGGKLLLNKKMIALHPEEKKELLAAFTKWMQEHGHRDNYAADVVFRVSGTGSIGVRHYLFLVNNRLETDRRTLVAAKQALPSSLTGHIKQKQPHWAHDAERVITIQQIMQHVSPAYLSAFPYQDHWFVVKELQPTADKVNLDYAQKEPGSIMQYAEDLGILTASAQLRSSGRIGAATADDLREFAEKDKWVKELAHWSTSYATQVKKDYKVFATAWSKGYFNE